MMIVLKCFCFYGNFRVIILFFSKYINLGLVIEYFDYVCVFCYNKNSLFIFLCGNTVM